MYAQCDIDGTQHLVMKVIIDCKKDSNYVPMSDTLFEYKGRQHIRKTTRGWHLCSQWHDGTST